MATEKPRFTITLDAELYEKVNDYQHAKKYATQTKAIADLIVRGAKSLGLIIDDDVMVAGTTDIAITDVERKLVLAYRKADIRARQIVELALQPWDDAREYTCTCRAAARGGGVKGVPASSADAATREMVPADAEDL